MSSKSIKDFIARQQQQFAERRRQQNEQGDPQKQQLIDADGNPVSAFVVPRSHAPSGAASSAAASTAAGATAQRSEKDRAAMLQSWSAKVEEFVNDATLTRMELPNLLSGGDRRELHELAAKYNLSHSSVGSGTQRRLVLSKDALFYRGSNAGISTGGRAFEPGGAMTSFATSSSSEGGGGVSAAVAGTGMRTMSRRERQEMRGQQDERDLYADTAALKGFRRFQDAVNPLAHAVEADDGGEFEVPLGFGAPPALTSAAPREARRRQRDDVVAAAATTTSASAAAGAQEEEDESAGDGNNEGSASVGPAALPVELVTAEQIVESCRVNEIDDAEIDGWIARFAAACCTGAPSASTERVVFCIDSADFVSACGPLARAKRGGASVAVITISAQQTESVGAAVDAVSEAIAARGQQQQLCLCLPGMPLFGEPLVVSLAFPMSSTAVDAAVMAAANKFKAQVAVV